MSAIVVGGRGRIVLHEIEQHLTHSGIGGGVRLGSLGRRQAASDRGIIDQGAAFAIACEFEILQSIGPDEVEHDAIHAIGYRQHAVGKTVLNRAEIDILQIDLIRSG
jgi:hypothetical protein